MRVAGFVLTGGKSSRMGQNKARLRIDSQFLVELVARAVADAAGNVTLVGDPGAFADLPIECLMDLRPGLGPLAGLESLLASGRAEFNLVVACDMPGVKSADLGRLLAICEQTGALCAMAVDHSGRRHPLCAVYRCNCLPFVKSALDGGRLRLLDLVEELKAVEVRMNSSLSNVNTPEQWAAWQTAQLV
jgi:molybdopterin-guanine dinucleotide biosynthesis protein A